MIGGDVRGAWPHYAGAVLAFLLVTAVLSACGSGEGSQVSVQEGESPQERLEAVNLDGIHSGNLELTVSFLQPSKKEEVWMRVGGQFRRLGDEGFPRVRISASAQSRGEGGPVDFNSSLMLLPNFGVVVYGHAFHEKAYELEPGAAEAINEKLEEGQEDRGDGDLMACVKAAEGVDLSQLVVNLKGERPRELSRRTPLFAVIGEVSLPQLASALIELAEDPRCGVQLRALGLPSASELKIVAAGVENQIEGTQIKIGLDRDGVPHLIYAVLAFKSPPGVATTFTFSWKFSQVNQVGAFLPSPGTRPFDALLRRFGANTDAVLQLSPRELVLGFLTGLSNGLTGQLP